jgi:hypothetical protein
MEPVRLELVGEQHLDDVSALLAVRDQLGGEAGNAAPVIFAGGFEGAHIEPSAEEGVTLVPAADLVAEPR